MNIPPLPADVVEPAITETPGNTDECSVVPIQKNPQDQELRRLRALLEEGLAGGLFTEDTDADWDELRAIAHGEQP
jgi:hypothetical protein